MPRPDQMTLPFAVPGFPVGSPQSLLPLAGLTLLAVEDSRFASDSFRLMCQRSGARLRRADTLAAAAAHLRVYRPDLVIIDIGLPDGSGADLIAQLARGPVPVLATSGDPGQRDPALRAGATGFLAKPVAGLSAFQAAVLQALPDHPGRPQAPVADITPDPLALADDFALALRAIEAGPDPAARLWLAGFLSGLAGQAQDPDLATEAQGLRHPDSDLSQLCGLLQARIATARPG